MYGRYSSLPLLFFFSFGFWSGVQAQDVESEIGLMTISFPFDVDTRSANFLDQVSGLPNSDELILEVRQYQDGFAGDATIEGWSCTISGSGGSGGWSVGGSCTIVFDEKKLASNEEISTDFEQISNYVDIARNIFVDDMRSNDQRAILTVLRGACYLHRPPGPRACFENFTADMCASAARSSGAMHTFAPGQRCGL